MNGEFAPRIFHAFLGERRKEREWKALAESYAGALVDVRSVKIKPTR